MLDQNTDRMWFVIGAVIVGAAIIFIANGSLPTLFARVSDTFGGAVDSGSEVVDQISPNVPVIQERGPNLFHDGNTNKWEKSEWGRTDNISIRQENGRYIFRAEASPGGYVYGVQQKEGSTGMYLTPGKTYTLSYDVRGDVDRMSYVYILNGSYGNYIDNQSIGHIGAYGNISDDDFTNVHHSFKYIDRGRSTEQRIMISTHETVGSWFEIRNVELREVLE